MATMHFTSDAGLAEITAKLSHTVPADGPRVRIEIGDDLSVLLDRLEWNELVRQGNAAFDDIPPRRPVDEYPLARQDLDYQPTDFRMRLPKGLL
ncbi:hypothetical protein [Rhodococcoides fascians]|uniref:hypothetical protein n=1 Tax=Rhodococcoides fascians TaxID=1828 RepID=UPI0005230B8F|nr:hypothetical protein [Rhodococcus fascians]